MIAIIHGVLYTIIGICTLICVILLGIYCVYKVSEHRHGSNNCNACCGRRSMVQTIFTTARPAGLSTAMSASSFSLSPSPHCNTNECEAKQQQGQQHNSTGGSCGKSEKNQYSTSSSRNIMFGSGGGGGGGDDFYDVPQGQEDLNKPIRRFVFDFMSSGSCGDDTTTMTAVVGLEDRDDEEEGLSSSNNRKKKRNSSTSTATGVNTLGSSRHGTETNGRSVLFASSDASSNTILTSTKSGTSDAATTVSRNERSAGGGRVMTTAATSTTTATIQRASSFKRRVERHRERIKARQPKKGGIVTVKRVLLSNSHPNGCSSSISNNTQKVDQHESSSVSKGHDKNVDIPQPAAVPGAAVNHRSNPTMTDFSECSSLSDTAIEFLEQAHSNSFADSLLSSFGGSSSLTDDDHEKQMLDHNDDLFEEAFDSYVVEVSTQDLFHFALQVVTDVRNDEKDATEEENEKDGCHKRKTHVVIQDVDPQSHLHTLLSKGDCVKAINGIVLEGYTSDELSKLISHIQERKGADDEDDQVCLTIEPKALVVRNDEFSPSSFRPFTTTKPGESDAIDEQPRLIENDVVVVQVEEKEEVAASERHVMTYEEEEEESSFAALDDDDDYFADAALSPLSNASSTSMLMGKDTRDVFLRDEDAVVLEWGEEGRGNGHDDHGHENKDEEEVVVLPLVTTKIVSANSLWQRDARRNLLLAINGTSLKGMTKQQITSLLNCPRLNGRALRLTVDGRFV